MANRGGHEPRHLLRICWQPTLRRPWYPNFKWTPRRKSRRHYIRSSDKSSGTWSTSLRAMLQHEFSNSVKGRINFTYSDYDKAYQNLYANAYDSVANTVTLSGYRDTTQRESITVSADLISELELAGLQHTLVTGLEFSDTSNDNDRTNPTFAGGITLWWLIRLILGNLLPL